MVIQFDENIAIKYGVNASIILCSIYLCVRKNEFNHEHFLDGKYWTKSSVNVFQKLHPYLGTKEIINALKKLEDDDIIVIGNYNTEPGNRSKWYALTDKGYSLLDTKTTI